MDDRLGTGVANIQSKVVEIYHCLQLALASVISRLFYPPKKGIFEFKKFSEF